MARYRVVSHVPSPVNPFESNGFADVEEDQGNCFFFQKQTQKNKMKERKKRHIHKFYSFKTI